MNRMKKYGSLILARSLLACLGILGLLGAGPALAVSYTITNLGVLPGETSSAARDINNAGQVVGANYVSGISFLYSDGVMTKINNTLGGTYTIATAINDAGKITGTACVPVPDPEVDYCQRAFLYSNGTMTNLGTLPISTYSDGYDINSSGQVAGVSHGTDQAFRYSNGVMTGLGTLGTGAVSYAYGINDLGQVVGMSLTGNAQHAFLYSNGVMTDIGTLPGRSGSQANRINNAGQVVGYSGNRAFLYSNGTMTDLGVLPGDTKSEALDINNAGQVVGTSSLLVGTNYIDRPFLYSNGVMVDLNTLVPGSGWTLKSVKAINDYGQMVGTGIINGQTRAFLMKPSPTITSLAPNSGRAGDFVVINGANFCQPVVGVNVCKTRTQALVKIGLAWKTAIYVSPNFITFTVPNGATTAPINVIVPDGIAYGPTFTVLP